MVPIQLHTLCGKRFEFQLIIFREKIFENLEWRPKSDRVNCYELWGTPKDILTTDYFDLKEYPTS